MRTRRRRDAGSTIARHAAPATRDKHEEMGFSDGWSTALGQLIGVAATL